MAAVDDRDLIGQLLGRQPQAMRPVAGGDIARSLCATFADGSRAMVKCARPGQPSLRIEAQMLRDLDAAGLPVPRVLAGDDTLLALEWIEHAPGALSAAAQRDAGRALARLHAAPPPDLAAPFGYGYDTVIGSLHQPNPPRARWVDFFRDQRLLHRADSAHATGRLPVESRRRIDRLAVRLGDWIDDPTIAPSLVHGDLWGGNMLGRAGGRAVFIDPAIYRGHGEVDLAMATLFHSVGEAFFEGYAELQVIAPGFFEGRRDLYNLYPLLVHVQLFGGGYVARVASTLDRLGW